MGHQNPVNHENGRPRIVRYADLVPCFDAFIDTRTPGSDKKENFTIIGPGVSENPNQHVHIAEPHGFNIGGARQPPGCVNSQHSHHTAEAFFVHSGTWSFDLGEHGNDANITLSPGDFISIPINLFRGFKNVGKDVGFLWGLLGGDDPGRVTWAPDVFDMANEYGLVLLENGMLIDKAKGETVPKGMKIMPVTSRDQVEELQKFDDTKLRNCCVKSDETVPYFSRGGMVLRHLIGGDSKLNWEHGFSASHITLMGKASSDSEVYNTADVVFVHQGQLTIKTDSGSCELGQGDTATLPRGIARQFLNEHTEPVEFIRVLGEP